MSKTIKRSGVFLFAAVLVLWLLTGFSLSSASAEGHGKVTLICRSENDILEKMEWNIYRVGSRHEDSFVSDGDFQKYYTSINNFTADHLSDMAYTLENVAILDNLPVLASRVADENGYLTFSGLEPGLYLLSGKKLKSGLVTYKPSPILLEIKEDDDTEFEIGSKIRRYLTLDGEVTIYTVKKVWDDEDNKYDRRPVSITVEIYMDSELYNTVELNASNDWTFQWSTNQFADWRVKEVSIAPDYTVMYRANDTQYAIINKLKDDDLDDDSVTVTTTSAVTTVGNGEIVTETTETTSDSQEATGTSSEIKTTETEKVKITELTPVTTVGSRLPQTGMLNWCAPVLLLGGTVFTAFSFRKKEDK